MTPVDRQKPARFEQPMNRDLIQQTAYYFFALRVILGVTAWIYYNEFVGLETFESLAVQLVFVSYLAGNSLICLRFRNGVVTRRWLRIDILLNIGTSTLVTALTGGLQSPLGIIVVIKLTGCLLVYGSPHALMAAGLAIAILGGISLGNQLGLWETTAAQQLDGELDTLLRMGLLATSLVGAPWLLRQVNRKDRQIQVESRRVRAAVERERAAHAVSRALLSVNEAVSRATRLHDVLGKIVDIAPHVLGIDYCGIFLWSEDEGFYRGAMVSGADPAVGRQFAEIKLTQADVPDFEWVRQLGHCAVVAARGISRLGLPEAPTLLMAPLRVGERFLGVLQLGRRDGNSVFTQNELLISDGIAAQAAVAIERARLVEESRRLSCAVESTGEAVIITDRRGQIIYVNPAFQNLFGYSAAQLKGGDGFAFASDLTADQLNMIKDHLSQQPWRGEAVGRRSDGSTFPMLINVSSIRSDDEPFQGIVAVVTDISAERQMQERMQRADRLAAAGQMASGVAHEINNALVGILGQAQMGRDSDNLDELRQSMRMVEKQGQRIADIVQQLLGFARPRPPERRATNLQALAAETLELMAAECRREHVTCVTDFSSIPSLVLADAKQLQQVLINLLTNAVHSMRANGGGILTVAVKVEGDSAKVEVTDTGGGIPSEDLSRVFDPFFTTKDVGTGLGLSVSYSIVRTHGGDLSARSVVGEGSTFTLSLPTLAPVQDFAAEVESALLVDDDPGVAETLISMLRREGLEVHHVATGTEALARADERSFDVVFLDVRLPDISGPEVYARLVESHPELAKRVVFVTGGLWRSERGGLREKLPPQPTLSKPCTSAQIREVLRLLRGGRAAA